MSTGNQRAARIHEALAAVSVASFALSRASRFVFDALERENTDVAENCRTQLKHIEAEIAWVESHLRRSL